MVRLYVLLNIIYQIKRPLVDKNFVIYYAFGPAEYIYIYLQHWKQDKNVSGNIKQFKSAIKKYVHTQSFCFVDEHFKQKMIN